MSANPEASDAGKRAGFALTPQQVEFFETFGFLKLSGLFTPEETAGIAGGFEEVFEGYEDPAREDVHVIKESRLHTNDRFHDNPRRYLIPHIVDRSPRLSWLNQDPRVRGIAQDLLGEGYESASSDGSLFFCETSWHPDFYMTKKERHHIKLSIYLESLRHDSGAIRVLPGTHFYMGEYHRRLWRLMQMTTEQIQERFGVSHDALPSYTIDTDPGDLVVWDFRIVHASFNGAPRRRLVSINFREYWPSEEGA